MSENGNRQNGQRPQDPKSLETRFGLVMYGGVSLAIYINGVAHEFFNAVRGRGAYRLIKALTDSDIVVDIVSGTSAGGINGIMLAYALTNKKEFSDAASLWRNDGDIRRLLRSPGGRPDGGWSLLDSEGFYQPQLEAAFRDMRDIPSNVAEDPSPFNELDLFVTGTDVDGNRFTQFDDAGHAIDVKDHRSVFHLKHRAGRKEQLNPAFRPQPGGDEPNREITYKALAKLARITSCFPAAFSPVTVANVPESEESADGRLQLWGKLGKESCFLDGGLIDNKPFTHTLREIFFRGAVRNVDRKLFYVEPDPEHWEKLESATQPNFFQAVVASLIGIPGYESISDDLKLLTSHNTKTERYLRVISFLEGQEVEDPTPQVSVLYLRSRVVALGEWVIRGILKIEGRVELLDKGRREKAAQLVKKFDETILKGDEDAPAPEAGAQNEDAEKLKKKKSDEAKKTYKRAEQILGDFDVDFRLRRLFRTTYFIKNELGKREAAVLVRPGDTVEKVMEQQADAGREGECDKAELNRALCYKQLWSALNRQIELLDIIRSAIEKVIEGSAFDWQEMEEGDVWLAAQSALACLLDTRTDAARLIPAELPEENPHEWLTKLLPDFNRKLRERASAIAAVTSGKPETDGLSYDAKKRRVAEPEGFESLLRRIDELEAKLVVRLMPDPDDTNDRVRVAYETFGSLDAKLFPVELVAELNEKDIIKTYRISPQDARRGFSNKGLSDKVSGDALYHFGGFFKRSWRSNDILWGRLDSLCQLVETLVTRERLGEILENPHLRARVRDRFFVSDGEGDRKRWKLKRAEKETDALLPSELFPNAGESVNNDLEKWLGELLVKEYPDTDEGRAEKKRVLGDTAAMCENLIEAAQFEVLVKDLPDVIKDALGEQVTWNQFRINKKKFEELEQNALPTKVIEEGETPPAPGGDGAAQPLIQKERPEVFLPPAGEVDPFFGVVAAAGQTEAWMRYMLYEDGKKKPTQTRLGRFFREDYKVGTEALMKDMPLLVLLEIISVSLLVLRNCILDIFDRSTADGARSNPLYIIFVEVPLRTFNLLIRFLRRAPRWEKQILSGVIVGSILTIILAVWGRGTILFDGEVFTPWPFVFLILLPALLLHAAYFYMRRESGKKKGKLGSVLRWAAALWNAALIVAPLVILGLFLARLPVGKNAEPVILGYDRDRLLLMAAALLSIVGPYIAYFFLSGRRKRRRIEATSNKLKTLLENYFSARDMRAVGRRLLSTLPLEWKEVEKTLADDAGNDAKKAANLGKLRKSFADYKYVRWGSLSARMKELGMDAEMRLIAEKKEYQIPVEDGDWPYVAEEMYDTQKKPGVVEAICNKMPERLNKTEVVQKFISPQSRRDWQRQQMASKLVAWADKTDNHDRLVAHMRFVNPEALYGE